MHMSDIILRNNNDYVIPMSIILIFLILVIFYLNTVVGPRLL